MTEIGLFRDPETHEPVKYYCKMPPDISERQVFVVDPMLATGASLALTFQALVEKAGRPRRTILAAAIASASSAPPMT